MAGQCWFVYYDWIEAFEALSPAELGRLTLCALKYSAQGETSELPGNERFTWPIIKSSIDRDNAKYKAKCETNRKNVQARYERIQTNTTVYDRIQTNTKEKEKEKKKSKNTFTPPTIEEVRSYCKERNSTVDPDQFYDYFTATDWHDSKGNKVKSWKGKIVTWEKFQPKQKDEDDKPDLSWFYGDDKNA